MSEEDGSVVILDMVTTHDIPAERVLRGALDADLEQVTIVGVGADGEEYFASSVADGGSVLWMIERAKLKLLQVVDD